MSATTIAQARAIQASVALRFGVTVAQMLGPDRRDPVASARAAAMVEVYRGMNGAMGQAAVASLFQRSKKYVWHAMHRNQRLKAKAQHSCDCGNPTEKKHGNEWVCQRCLEIESRQ